MITNHVIIVNNDEMINMILVWDKENCPREYPSDHQWELYPLS